MDERELPPVGTMLSQFGSDVGKGFLELMMAGIGVWFIEGVVGFVSIGLVFGSLLLGLKMESPGLLLGCSVASLVGMIGLTIAVNVPVHAGMHRAVLRHKRTGEELSVGSPFADLWTDLGKLIALGVVEGLIIWVGTLLLVVPGIVAAIALSLAYPAIIVHRVSVGEAIRMSVAHTRRHFGWHAGIWVVGVAIQVIAPWIPILGGILLVPLLSDWHLRAYAHAFGDGDEPLTA